jgi:hypothetical protein
VLRRSIARRTALATVLVIGAFGLAACGSDEPDKAADDDRLTVYSGRSEALVAPI